MYLTDVYVNICILCTMPANSEMAGMIVIKLGLCARMHDAFD